MIYDAIRMAGYDEAAPAGNGSDTDGVAVKAVGLPMSVMSLHGLPIELHPVRISQNETKHLRGSKCSVKFSLKSAPSQFI